MATADGHHRLLRTANNPQPPATVNDVIAVTAFIGSIFGAGGGAEASNAEFLAKLQNHLGAEQGREAWEDAMLFNDPEAPTTITQPFDYGPLTGGPVTGSATIDEGSIESFEPAPVEPAPGRSRARRAARRRDRRPTELRRSRPPGRCRRSRRRTSSSSTRRARPRATASR